MTSLQNTARKEKVDNYTPLLPHIFPKHLQEKRLFLSHEKAWGEFKETALVRMTVVYCVALRNWWRCNFLTNREAKVKFSHASVILFTREWVCIPACTWAWGVYREVYTAGRVWPGMWTGGGWDTPQTATAAACAHSTSHWNVFLLGAENTQPL